MDKKKGYRTVTYRFRLYCEHMDWLKETKQMYNKMVAFYYSLMLQEPEILEVPKQKRMRALEEMTVGTREGKGNVKYPIPYKKVPLYFRRAAINDAIRLQESVRSRQENRQKEIRKFNTSPIYYKGMYQELTSCSICLKVFTGEEWTWIKCGIDTCGWEFPAPEQMMSPIIVINNGIAMLHVPVREEVDDIRTVKERLEAKEKISAVYFPNADAMAVLVVLNVDGTYVASRFFYGGDKLRHQKKQILERIEKNRKNMGGTKGTLPENENKRWKEKIHRLTEAAVHQISKEIVDFCEEQDVKILVVPGYHQGMDFNHIGYVNTNNYDWLGRRMISYLKYKAFGKGIVVATASTQGIASTCCQCGAKIKKYNKEMRPGINFYGGTNFLCPNGHRGNSYFNSAMKVGKNFLEQRSNEDAL